MASTDTKQYFAVTGEALSKTSILWNGGEPNDNGGVEYVIELGENGFNDDDLNTMDQYVCECDGRPATRSFDFQ